MGLVGGRCEVCEGWGAGVSVGGSNFLQPL